jgi:threonine dehydratase
LIPKELLLENIIKVHNKLSPYVLRTPLLKAWPLISEIFDTNIYFKMEFLQHSGTFKARGAVNNILNLSELNRSKGITAVSAGNHAIATSYVANKFKLKNKIYIYNSANKYRVNKCKEMNANIFFTNPHSAFKDVEKTSKEEGYYFIHPFDGMYTLQGTASLGLEICNQLKNIDNIIISVGGGGLIGGVGSVIKQFYPNCNVIGVEPEGAQGLTDSLKLNDPVKNVKINTIADSLSAPLHMSYSFSICQKVIDKIVTVSDKEMINAMKFMFEKSKMLLEPACVAGIAALMGPLKDKFKNQKTLIVLCGSNIDVKSWSNLIS